MYAILHSILSVNISDLTVLIIDISDCIDHYKKIVLF